MTGRARQTHPSTPPRSSAPRWRRGHRVAVASCAALVVAASAVQATAGAQSAEFIPGEATAVAKTVTVGLSPGSGAPIEFGLGNSIASYQNATAKSGGTVLDLGLLELFLGPSSQCGELPAIIPEEMLPAPTTADSRRTTTQLTPLEVRSPGRTEFGGVLGTQFADATPSPVTSSASTTTVTQDLGLLALDGGSTEVTTSVNNGVREARAVTKGDRLRVFGDIITIYNPRWEAIARSGATETAEGSFTFTKATVFGIERSASSFPGDFNNVAGGVANLLGFLGVYVKYPTVEVADGTVTVSPLELGILNPPIGKGFLKPLFEFLEPIKEKSYREQLEQDCNNQGLLQVLDLTLGVLGGTGSTGFSIGGVSAMTAATEFPDALDLGLTLEEPQAAAPLDLAVEAPTEVLDFATPDLGSSGSFGNFDDSSDYAPVDTFESAPVAAVEASPTTVAQKKQQRMAATAIEPVTSQITKGKTGGAAAAVGGLGVVGLIALAGADRFMMRRNKREITD